MLPRVLLNPSLRGGAIFRLAGASPGPLLWFWRNILVAHYACDLAPGPKMVIGPGLMLPHPIGICISRRVVIGSNVTISHHVSIGGDGREVGVPVIEDNVFISPGAVVLGRIRLGEGSWVRPNTVLGRDLPAGTVHKG